MDLSKWLNDERLLANLIGIHIALAVVLILSLFLRKMLKNTGEGFVRWTGMTWLDTVSKEAVRSMRSMLFWATIALMVGVVVSMVIYHFSGRHAHDDFKDLSSQLTTAHLLAFSLTAGKLVALA